MCINRVITQKENIKMRLKEYYLEKFQKATKELNELSSKLYKQSDNLDDINEEFGEYGSTQKVSKLLTNVIDLISMAVEEIDMSVDKINHIVSELTIVE